MITPISGYLISIFILLLGSAISRLARSLMEQSLEGNAGDSPLPQDMQPEALGDWADWVADMVSAGTTLVGPFIGFVALRGVDPDAAIVVTLAGVALSTFLLVWVSLQRSEVATWSTRYIFWLSPVAVWGIGANIAGAALTVGWIAWAK